MTEFRGRWAVVTGASSGIGEALARELAAAGSHLVLTARRHDRLEETAAELRAQYDVQVKVFAADLAQREAPERIFNFTEHHGVPVDVLINNAGFGAYGRFHSTPADRLLEMVQVNVAAVVHLTRLYVPLMVARRSGYVMIVASTAAFQPVPYISTYAATKGFDMLLAEGLAEELRPHGVRVSALCPGSTESEFHAVAGQPSRTARRREAADKVARVGLEALAAGRPRVVSGRLNWVAAEAQRFVPRRVVARAAAALFAPRP